MVTYGVAEHGCGLLGCKCCRVRGGLTEAHPADCRVY